MSDTPKSIPEVIKIFRSEFSALLTKFVIFDLTLDTASDNRDAGVDRPGVYVYWKAGLGVIKVGKSQSNARARALQHIRDNTKNVRLQMSGLANDSSCHLILFTVPNDGDIHWVLSLEYFLEKNLEPVIRSDRSG